MYLVFVIFDLLKLNFFTKNNSNDEINKALYKIEIYLK